MQFREMTHDEMLDRLRIVTHERNGLRDQLAAAKASMGRILESMGSEAAMRQREHAAILYDSWRVRALVEGVAEKARQEVANLQRRAEHAAQELEEALDAVEAVTKERDQARQEADLLRRQVRVLVYMAMFAPCAHCAAKDLCDNQPAATPCEENIAAWAAQQAKEGGK